ncbi:hypothetical protein V8E55_009341 [Tylopilus felleus]
MPKRPKGGPPYTDVPDEVYVVVTDPWGMNTNPRERIPRDFNRVASWARFALQQAGLDGGHIPTVECIYSMGTRSEIILQFSEDTNIVPLLGEHRWANFAKDCRDPNRSTCVFLYNWRNNGDPANHNWTENFPQSLPLDKVPAKSPYPAPSWTSPPPTLTNLVLPIPRPLLPPPIPNNVHNLGQEQQSITSPSPAPPQQVDHPQSAEQPAEQESASTNLFKPYEPPAQHPSHAQFLNQSETRGGDVSSSQARPPSPKFVKKLDPYELEEDALSIIRAPNPKREDTEGEDVKPTLHFSVKVEIPEVKEEDGGRNDFASSSTSQYQPSQALIDAFNSLSRPEESTSSAHPPTRESPLLNATSQRLPPASLGYQPSAELEAEINALLRGRSTTASSTPSSGDTRLMPGAGTRISIKREHEDDMATSLGKRKKIKIEED